MILRLIIIFYMFFSVGCRNEPKNQNKVKMNRKSYFLNYDFGGQYIIYCNGIIVAESRDSEISHSYRILNPFISGKGKQTISIKIEHPNKEIKINPKDLDNLFLEIYVSENGEKPPFKKIKKLKFPPINKPVDSLFYTWDFDADVNYERIGILDNASDLTKENPNELLKAVLNKYQENHDIINRGELDEYDKLIEERIKRETTSMYYSDEEIKNYKNKVLQRVKSSKGLMQPIEDYHLVIHLNKKIVNLVNKKGEPVLYSKDQNSNIKTYGLKLYRDSKTGKLKVF